MKRLLLIFILILSCDIFGQGFNEDKTAFSNYLKRMFNNSPFEGVKIVDDYDKQYLISLVALDKSKYKSHSVLNRVAQVKARQQASTFINGSTISSDLLNQLKRILWDLLKVWNYYVILIAIKIIVRCLSICVN